MSDGGKFSCDACSRSYTWKEELAGKRVKCKCGQVMTVPEALAEPEFDENALYDLADAEAEAAKSSPALNRVVEAPVKPAAVGGKVRGAAAAAGGRGVPGGAQQLGYQRGPTERERERMSSKTLIDINRDVYVPVGLMIAGMVLQVAFYAVKYQMGGTGVALTTLGLGMMTVFKAVLLIGFALVAAGPLGVSFGGVWSCALKLLALAAFADGVTTWVDAGMDKLGAGGLGYMISFPIALATYWLLLIYLFSMDAGDSWTVVILLAVFDYVVRMVILLLLLRFVLGLGGVAGGGPPIPTFGGGSGTSTAVSPIVQQVAEAQERKALEEARKFIAGGRQEVMTKPVEDWYAAGAKNVWFEVGHDVALKPEAVCVIVELPKEKDKRQKCRDILKAYMEAVQMDVDPADLKEDDEPYMIVPIR